MNTSYLDEGMVFERLVSDYEKHQDLLIGFDFDDTVFDLHEQDINVKPIIDILIRAQNLGLTLCMWTAITDDWSLTYKKHIIKGLGINPIYVNESPAMNHSRKPHFNILLDDRAGLASAYTSLQNILTYIETKKSIE